MLQLALLFTINSVPTSSSTFAITGFSYHVHEVRHVEKRTCEKKEEDEKGRYRERVRERQGERERSGCGRNRKRVGCYCYRYCCMLSCQSLCAHIPPLFCPCTLARSTRQHTLHVLLQMLLIIQISKRKKGSVLSPLFSSVSPSSSLPSHIRSKLKIAEPVEAEEES